MVDYDNGKEAFFDGTPDDDGDDDGKGNMQWISTDSVDISIIYNT